MRTIKSGGRQDSRRGSALLTAVIFAFIVAALMGSYLKMASTEHRIASRSFMMNGVFNLAEGEVELAMDAINNEDSTGWTKGMHSGDAYWSRLYSGYSLGAGLEGEIRVVVVEPNSSAPTIYSQGRIVGSSVSADLNRQITVTLDNGFFPWKNGVDSKSGFDLKGNNVTVDSYNSDLGEYGVALSGGGKNMGSEATVSTISITDSANVGNADIYGYVATGKFAPNVGKNGSITTYSNPGVVDASRVTTDYYAEFPNVSAPALSFPSNSFPTSGSIGSLSDSLVGVKHTQEYKISGNWSADGELHIYDDVILVIDGDMSMSGNKKGIYLHGDATLTVYTYGNVSLSGKGVANGYKESSDSYSHRTAGTPESFKVFGLDQTAGGTTIAVTGNGAMSGVIYAPNSNLEIKGGGNSGRVLGAMVGYDVKFTGNAFFSYDEALSDYNIGDGGYSVEDWVEMTSIDLNTTPVDLSVYQL